MTEVIVNNTDRYLLPDSFNSLTGKQLCAIAPVLLKGNPTLEEKYSVAYFLCGFGNKYFSLRESLSDEPYLYFTQQIYEQVMPALEFLYAENTLTEQLLPMIRVQREQRFFATQKLYGPAKNFENLTIAEFSDAETCIDNYEESKDELWLNRFLAVLYHPGSRLFASPDGRKPYNFHMNDLIAEMVSKVDAGTKAAIVLWFHGCRAQLVKDFGSLFSKAKAQTNEKTSWTAIIHDMAGAKFGTIDQTAQQPVRVIFYELNLLHQKANQ